MKQRITTDGLTHLCPGSDCALCRWQFSMNVRAASIAKVAENLSRGMKRFYRGNGRFPLRKDSEVGTIGAVKSGVGT
jgi:hypothetical protein